MKIQIMSDLHHEFGHMIQLKEHKDTTLILAGDIDSKHNRLNKFIKRACNKYADVLMVAGNHEFYHNDYDETINFLRKIDENNENFYFLENDTFEKEGIIFIGATLWSNPSWGVFNRINDAHLITHNGRRFNEDTVRSINAKSSEYIKHQLKEFPNQKKIVITHFGPDKALMHPRWLGNPEINTYFWAQGFQYHFQYTDMWIYGHTHDSNDKVLDGCRCVCNPYGYFGYEPNRHYNHEMILEV